jgi:NAD(P) transhydrogenase subunit alpha
VITAAFVPGRRAPVLLREETVARMKPGSVIVDLGIEQGGNCALTEADRVVLRHGVRIVGYTNVASQVAADASALYARNLLNFVKLIVDPGTGALKIDTADEIVSATLVCADGARTHATTTTLA